ncbi:MAG: PKD domain-containing protein [Bacteroidia bacterium]
MRPFHKKYPLLCTVGVLLAQLTLSAQVKSLFINSYSNIVKLNSVNKPVDISYTGIKYGFEAIAHAEDNKGNILFFVNSNGVYNSKGELMQGSEEIFANPSSAEINICHVPGDKNRYYVFYNSELCSPLYYSIVDMQLNNGLGDVVKLNTPLDSMRMAEGIELIKRPCTNNYWLIAYECGKGYKRYTIDEKGVSQGVPMYAHAGPTIYVGRGELDYHNGRLGHSFSNSPVPLAFFCDFDELSGTICNPKNIELPEGGNGVYGMEFSPDATKAYITEWYNNRTDNLFQYDFETGKVSSYYITSTRTDTSKIVAGPGQIELGADGRLYIPFDGGNQITVIENPNSSKPVFSRINTNSDLALGVSDHIQSEIFKPSNNFTFERVCLSETTRFRFKPSDCTAQKAKLLWDFGDPESHKKNIATEASPGHYYSKAGNYTVTLYVNDGAISDTISHTITISAIPKVNLGKDTSFCPGQSVTLNAGVADSYNWSTAAYDQKITVSSTGKYWVNVSNKGCIASDTIAIALLPKPTLELGNDLWLCDEKSHVLNAGEKAKSYLWSTGATTSKINISETGIYSVRISNAYCTSDDTIDAVFQISPVVKLGRDTAFCSPGWMELNAGAGADAYLWSTGETTQKIIVNRTDTYSVTVNKGTCITRDEIDITVSEFKPVIAVPALFTVSGKTPVFKISTENVKDFHLRILNAKTNKEVYESTDAIKYWDGKLPGGTEAESGVYNYSIEYRGKCGPASEVKQGTFTLSR